MGGIFVKNSFILGKKLNTPKNFLLSVEAKFNRGISLIISTVIWSYVTPFFKWRQKDEWNSLEDSRAPFPVEKTIAIRLMGKKMPSAKHWFCLTEIEKPLLGGCYLFFLYYFLRT